MLFMRTAMRSRKKNRFCISLEESLRSFHLIFPKWLSCLVGYRILSFIQVFFSKCLIKWFCVHLQLFKFTFITEIVKEVVVQLQHSQLCILKYEKTNPDGFSCSMIDFSISISYKFSRLYSVFLIAVH